MRDARDARGRRAGACGRRSARCSAATARSSATPRARSRRCARPSRGSTASALAGAARRRRRRRSPPARRAFGALEPRALRAWARWDVEFGILERAARRRRARSTRRWSGPRRSPDAHLEGGTRPSSGWRARRVDQRGALARHARARDDEVEARRLGAQLHVVVRRASRRRASSRPLSSPAARSRSTSATPSKPVAAEVDDQHVGVDRSRAPPRAAPRGRPAVSIPSTLEPSSRSSKTATTRAIYCARMRRNSWRTDSRRPHICTVSTRPVRSSRSTSSPRIPASSSSFSVPCVGRRRGGVAELVGDQDPPVPVVVRVRLRVDLHDQRRGVDVARLVDAQVELEVGPVGRQRVDDLLELVGERHDVPRNLAVMADPPPPPDPDDPLAPARGLGLDGLLDAARAARRRERERRRARRARGRRPVDGRRRGAPARGRAAADPQPAVLR